MTQHATGTRQEWLAARLKLLDAEKELAGSRDMRSQFPREFGVGT